MRPVVQLDSHRNVCKLGVGRGRTPDVALRAMSNNCIPQYDNEKDYYIGGQD